MPEGWTKAKCMSILNQLGRARGVTLYLAKYLKEFDRKQSDFVVLERRSHVSIPGPQESGESANQRGDIAGSPVFGAMVAAHTASQNAYR